MPMVYGISLATAGNTTTNATPSTENETFFVKAGVRNCAFQAMYAGGMGVGLTAISGIAHKIIKWGTASTAGTGSAIVAKDPGMQAAKFTSSTAPTAGTTRTQGPIFTHGAAGPGGYVAPNPDSVFLLEGGGAFSIDGLNVSGTASLPFTWSAEFQE